MEEISRKINRIIAGIVGVFTVVGFFFASVAVQVWPWLIYFIPGVGLIVYIAEHEDKIANGYGATVEFRIFAIVHIICFFAEIIGLMKAMTYLKGYHT